MTRISVAVAFVAALAGAGCNKPSADQCSKALANMRVLIGVASPTDAKGDAGDVRACRGGSTRKSVACASQATTLEELKKCDFMGSGKHRLLTPPAPAGSAQPAPATPAQ